MVCAESHGDGLVAIGGGARDFYVRQESQHQRQSFTDHALVIGNENTYRLAHAGTRNSTRKPPRVIAVVRSPPSSSARSRIPVRP